MLLDYARFSFASSRLETNMVRFIGIFYPRRSSISNGHGSQARCPGMTEGGESLSAKLPTQRRPPDCSAARLLVLAGRNHCCGCRLIRRGRGVPIGRDGDGERTDFSDFSVRATKRQASTLPVRRDLIPHDLAIIELPTLLCAPAAAGPSKAAGTLSAPYGSRLRKKL